MLPRTHRLRHRSDYQGLYRAGRGWSHSLLTLQLAPQETGQRVGVVVSKKVGGAVVRNRVRRRIREAVRAQLPDWKIGFAAAVAARNPAAEATLEELGGALADLARRARLVREPLDPPGTSFSMAARLPRNSRGRPGSAELQQHTPVQA